MISASKTPVTVFTETDKIIEHLMKEVKQGDHILVMSNGGFEAIHQRLLDALEAQ